MSSSTSSTDGSRTSFTFDLPSVSQCSSIVSELRQVAGADKPSTLPVKAPQRETKSPGVIFGCIMVIIAQGFLGIGALAGAILIGISYMVSYELWGNFGAQCFGFVLLIVVTVVDSRVAAGFVAIFLGILGLGELGSCLFVAYYGYLYDGCKDYSDAFADEGDWCRYVGTSDEIFFLTFIYGVTGLFHAIMALICCIEACRSRRTVVAVAKPQPLAQHQASKKKKSRSSKKHRRSTASTSSKTSKSGGTSITSKTSSKKYQPPPQRPYRSRSMHSLSTRSIASTQFPDTSSMQTYVPPPPILPSQSLRSTCPIAASECSVSGCPYYRGHQHQTQALQPYVAPPKLGYDPNRSIIIDLPQSQGHNHPGYVDIQRVVINLPQTQGINQQVQPERRALPPPSGIPQDQQAHVYYTSVVPMGKR